MTDRERREPSAPQTVPNYDTEAPGRAWESYRRELAGLPDGAGLNIAYEAVDRQVAAGRGAATAFRFLDADAEALDMSYAELAARTDRFAAALAALGVEPGETVATLLGRTPELYVTALGALKARAVFSPLFSSFGPEPVRARLSLGAARVLVTSRLLYGRKVESIRAQLPDLQHVLLIDGNGEEPAGTRDFARLLADAPPSFEIPPTDPHDPALLHFTSGTTGTPKGAVHVHEAVVVHQATARRALGLEPGTVYWCTADPGWVTGISYGLVAPLVAGATAVVDTQEFEADRWYGILSAQAVEVWYTAPTAIRLLERQGPEAARRFRFSALRHLASVGEPLEREAVEWGREVFGTPFHDTWWQTETGGIMIGNFPGTEVRAGSMGKPFPGVRAAVIERTGTEAVVVDRPDEAGQLALATPWPSMFREYRGEPERYRQCFAGGWYLTGDLVRRDRDGYYWFVGRVDDAIQSAGHLIGPFEVEAVMMEHPAVVDAAAIGKPDPVAFETVAVCVVLREGTEATPELERELLAHARRRLGPAVAPRSIYFRTSLPRTPSGKILRRQLRDEITKQT